MYSRLDENRLYHNTHSEIPFNIILHLRLGLPTSLFPFSFPINILYAFLSAVIYATCPAHLALHKITILIILVVQYKL
jgi:hypothetical protein